MSVGLITHLDNPSLADIRNLGQAAEEAGADWLGVPDAFWWRDAWVLLAELARVTERLVIGPVVTNPYTRHPFATLSALATLQDLAGPRIMVGLGAGGSEIAGAAGVSRADAPERTVALAGLIRGVARGAPLDQASGRTLDVPLALPTIVVGGRGNRMLRAGGQVADQVLLWAVPGSDLDRTIGQVARGAAAREADLAPVRLTWAPLVAHDDASRGLLGRAATYAVLNNGPEVLARWGVGPDTVRAVRQRLVAGDVARAERDIPPSVVDDLATDADPARAGQVAARIGADAIALAATDVASIGDRVRWAHKVLAVAAGSRSVSAGPSPAPVLPPG